MPRKVILGFGISIDGYIARRNGAMDYLAIDKEGEALMADFFAKIDTTIMGRKTATGWVKMRESGEIPNTPGMANCVISRGKFPQRDFNKLTECKSYSNGSVGLRYERMRTKTSR